RQSGLSLDGQPAGDRGFSTRRGFGISRRTGRNNRKLARAPAMCGAVGAGDRSWGLGKLEAPDEGLPSRPARLEDRGGRGRAEPAGPLPGNQQAPGEISAFRLRNFAAQGAEQSEGGPGAGDVWGDGRGRSIPGAWQV